jgi:outer membrane biosynthesis protein TonB
MPLHTTHTRDAALRQLHRINRWLIAGSVVLAGVFAEAAANAFPGRTTKTTSASKVKRSDTHTIAPSKTTTHSLQPPAHPPQATTESSSAPDPAAPSQETPAASPESAPASEPAPAQESAPTHESAPAQESTPARETTPTHESAPAEESAPVVSGGS